MATSTRPAGAAPALLELLREHHLARAARDDGLGLVALQREGELGRDGAVAARGDLQHERRRCPAPCPCRRRARPWARSSAGSAPSGCAAGGGSARRARRAGAASATGPRAGASAGGASTGLRRKKNAPAARPHDRHAAQQRRHPSSLRRRALAHRRRHLHADVHRERGPPRAPRRGRAGEERARGGGPWCSPPGRLKMPLWPPAAMLAVAQRLQHLVHRLVAARGILLQAAASPPPRCPAARGCRGRSELKGGRRLLAVGEDELEVIPAR